MIQIFLPNPHTLKWFWNEFKSLNTSDEWAASIPAVSFFFRSRGFKAQNFTYISVGYNTIQKWAMLYFLLYTKHAVWPKVMFRKNKEIKIHCIHIPSFCTGFYLLLYRGWWRKEEETKLKSTDVSHRRRMEKGKKKSVRVPLAYHRGRQYGPICNNRHHHEPGTALQSLRLWTWSGSRGDSELARRCGRGRGSPESEMKGCSAALVWRGPGARVKRLRLKGVPCHQSLVLDIPDKGRETEGRD